MAGLVLDQLRLVGIERADNAGGREIDREYEGKPKPEQPAVGMEQSGQKRQAGVSRALPDRPPVTRPVYVSKPALKVGSASLPTHLSPSLTAYSPPSDQAMAPRRWLASEPPLKAKPSTSLPFSSWIFFAAAVTSSQLFGTSILRSSNQSLR